MMVLMNSMTASEPSVSSGSAWDLFQAKKHFGNLDGLRCLSIVAVVWEHGPGLRMTGLAAEGFTGVWLFFAISGFLITTLLLREYHRTETISLLRFYARRSLRIFPLYYAVLGLYSVLIPLIAPRETTQAFQSNIPYFLTYTSNWFVGGTGTFGFAWSLAAEEQFYSVWPSLLRYLKPRGAFWIATGILVAGLLLEVWHPARPYPWPLVILENVSPALCWGCILAFLADSKNSFAILIAVLGGRWSSAVVLIMILLMLAVFPQRSEVLSLLFAALVGTCVLREDTILGPLLRHPAVIHIGVVSYGVYLLHGLVYDAGSVLTHMAHTSWDVHGVAGFGLVLIVSVGVATLSYRYYESIFLRFKQRFESVRL
jgi:peptidoglycan/LPS O-acetylase OafA/YrhL